VTKQRNRLALRAFGIGISSGLIALACGSDNKPSDGAQTPARETCADNQLLAGCPDVTPVATPDTNPPDTTTKPGDTTTQPDPTPKPAPSDPRALAKAAAENILNADCGSCHGPKLTTATAQAGMNYINDIDQLVKNNKIIPLNSAGSLLIQRMTRGEMPPTYSTLPRVTDAEINTVASFIDNPVFWPGVAPQDCSSKSQVVDFDQLYRTVNQDLAIQNSQDTPFLRYVSLTNRFTAGVCADTALDKDRQALTKMMNMLSVRATIGDVVPVNKDNTIYRIDLRDFDWNRAITVNNQNFTDVWEAIVTNNPYTVELIGDDANRAKLDTQTTVPVMFADQMMDVATIGNLYYAIINVDITQKLGDFILNDLGIDVNTDLVDRKEIRAGTTKSRITRQDRVVERHDIGVRAGVLWESFDFEANNANNSIFQNPFGFAAGGKEAIFSLPNGMLGFVIADANDNFVQDSDILLDTSQSNFKAVTSVSCSNCHALGFIPVVDEVRDVALANARDIGLNRDQIEQLQDIYVTPAAFQKTVAQDSTGFYQNALQRATLPTQGSDPVASVWLRFDADMTIKDAAGDLGLKPSELSDNLDLLDPVLSVLRKSTLDRDDFTAVYIASLCRLSTLLENQPDPNVCATALQAIGQ